MTTPDRVPGSVLLTTAQVAAILQVSERTVKRLRAENNGPHFVRIGAKQIRYPAIGVKLYLERMTSDAT